MYTNEIKYGQRKNITDLWTAVRSNLPTKLKRATNIAPDMRKEMEDALEEGKTFTDRMIEERDQLFYYFKEQYKEEDFEIDNELEDELKDKAKQLMDFELLYFMLIVASESKTVAFESRLNLLSGIKETIPESYNKVYLQKARTLFKGIFSSDYYEEALVCYMELPSSLRLLSINDKVIEPEEPELYFEDSFEIETRTNPIEYIELSLNEVSARTSNRKSLYNMIIRQDFPYKYRLIFYPFPTTETMSSTICFETKEKDAKYFEIGKILEKSTFEAIHTYDFSRFINECIEQKQKRDISQITFNIMDLAIELDEILQKEGLHTMWVNRVKGIRFKEVNFYADRYPILGLDPTHTITLKEASHIVGMLGVGKSTFTTLLTYFCVKNKLRVAHITKDKDAIIDSYLTLRKAQIKDIGIFRGNFDAEEFLVKLIARWEYDENLLTTLEEHREIFKCFDSTEKIKQRALSINDGIRSSFDTISLSASSKSSPKTYANPEYKEFDKYYWIEKLMSSYVWIGNIDSLLQTKMPYQYDYLRRDIYTIVHLACDVIIMDEIDELNVKADEKYINIKELASSTVTVSSGVHNDEIERELPDINKRKFSTEFQKEMITIYKQQEALTSNIFSFVDNYYIASRLKHSFSMYSLIKDFLRRYFGVKQEDGSVLSLTNANDNKLTKDAFKKLLVALDVKFNIFSKPYEETLFHMGQIVLKTQTYLESAVRPYQHKKSNRKFIAAYIKEHPEITFTKTNDETSNLDKIQCLTYQFLLEFSESLGLEIKEYAFQDNPEVGKTKVLNPFVYKDLCFLLMFKKFDFYQTRIMEDSQAFGIQVNKRLSNENFKSNTLPAYPSPLINRNLLYKFKTTQKYQANTSILEITEYLTIGRKVLIESRDIVGSLEPRVPMPIVVMLSATSYMHEATKYHIACKPNYLLYREDDNIKINMSLSFAKDSSGKIINVSGSGDTARKIAAVEEIVKDLESRAFFANVFKKLDEKYKDPINGYHKRQIIGVAVPSFELAHGVCLKFRELLPSYKVKCLFKDGHTFNKRPIEYDEGIHVRKEDVTQLYTHDVDIFIFVVSSIGRGYNLLQSATSQHSLIGAMLFPIRPYLHPDDSTWPIHIMHSNIGEDCQMFRHSIQKKYPKYNWNKHSHVIFNKLASKNVKSLNEFSGMDIFWKELDEKVKISMVANFLVELLQVMGRGLRGGTDLDVYLLDGSFVSDQTREKLMNSETLNPTEIPEILEEPMDSFLSVAETILTDFNKDDELFKVINRPLIEAFRNKVLAKNQIEEG